MDPISEKLQDTAQPPKVESFAPTASVVSLTEVHTLNISELRVKPRLGEEFSSEELDNLASSLNNSGQRQPIRVAISKDGEYEVIAGNRRVIAARANGKKQITAMVYSEPLSEAESLAEYLLDDLHSRKHTTLENAEIFKNLMDLTGLSESEVAIGLDIKPIKVTNALKLLKLSPLSKQSLKDKRISTAAAYEIATLPEADQIAVVELATTRKLPATEVKSICQSVLADLEKLESDESSEPEQIESEAQKNTRSPLGSKGKTFHAGDGIRVGVRGRSALSQDQVSGALISALRSAAMKSSSRQFGQTDVLTLVETFKGLSGNDQAALSGFMNNLGLLASSLLSAEFSTADSTKKAAFHELIGQLPLPQKLKIYPVFHKKGRT